MLILNLLLVLRSQKLKYRYVNKFAQQLVPAWLLSRQYQLGKHLLVNHNPNLPFYFAWIQSYSLKLVNVNTESKTRGWAQRVFLSIAWSFFFFFTMHSNLRCALYTGKYAMLSETIQWLPVTRGQPGSFWNIIDKVLLVTERLWALFWIHAPPTQIIICFFIYHLSDNLHCWQYLGLHTGSVKTIGWLTLPGVLIPRWLKMWSKTCSWRDEIHVNFIAQCIHHLYMSLVPKMLVDSDRRI